jgi:hypothetical protein
MTKYFNASKKEINSLGFDPDELLDKYNSERRGGPANLDKIRGRDKWNSAGYAAAASD